MSADRTAPPRRKLNRTAPRLMQLEQRLMFDGAAVDTTAAVVSQQAAHDAAAVHDAPVALADVPAYAQQRQEIVFIDTSVADWQALAAGTKPGVEVVLLDAARDGLQQISQTLDGRSGIAAVHIVSHGADGMVRLGTSQLDSTTLAADQATLAAWGSHLAADADILLYGCDVVADAAGRAFVEQLAQVTGADVAASSNETGAAQAGADWTLEYRSGALETAGFLTDAAAAGYQNRLDTVNLSGSSGWTTIMYGVNKDPVGDSQAGAADTDIVGDSSHGSLYTAYDDNGTASTADDTLVFRMRIDNPTSTSNFAGVAIVGMDANGDGRVDLFMSVDGRNNGQAVKLLDPGTGANISPSTTSTAPLPTGWLANNGVYSFSGSNYSVVAVSAATDPHWNGDTDLGNDGHADAFVSWRVPIGDIATVLAKASPVDRNGNYGPRGASGIAGFTKDTTVSYVNFTQTQTGPINGDLNGVGGSYDKNATFASLGVFTAPMTASAPVSASETVHITAPIDADGLVNAGEDNAVTVTGTSVANGWVKLTVSDAGSSHSSSVWTQANAGGTWTVATGDLSGYAQGTLTFSAELVTANGGSTVVSGSSGDLATTVHDSVAPVLTVSSLATSGYPTVSGTSDLPAGALVSVTLDNDNVVGGDVVYLALVQAGGGWSVNTASATPSSGSVPAGGYTSYTRVTANASDAAGNAATEVQAITRPTVTTLVTQSTTPTISGTWNATAGDTLSVAVRSLNGATTYWSGTPSASGNTWSVATGSLATGTYDVVVTVTRGGTAVADTSSSELTIVSAPVVVTPPALGISSMVTAQTGNDTTTYTGLLQAGDSILNRWEDNTVTVTGTSSGAVGMTVSVTVSDGASTPITRTGTIVNLNGNWTVAGFDLSALKDGTLTVNATLIDTGTRATAYTGVSHDATAPVVAATSGSMTNSNNPSVLGYTDANAASSALQFVSITKNGSSQTAPSVTLSGNAWSFASPSLANYDTLAYTLRGTDAAGNETTFSSYLFNFGNNNYPALTITTVGSTTIQTNANTVTSVPAFDRGGDTTVALSGTWANLTTGSTINLTISDQDPTTADVTATALATSGGTWTVSGGVNLHSLALGQLTVTASQAGSVTTGGGGGTTYNFTVADSTPVTHTWTAAPTIAITTPIGDGNLSAGEDSSVTISGTSGNTTAGTSKVTVSVTDGNGHTVATSTNAVAVTSGGAWTTSLNLSSLPAGTLTVTATVDKDGSAASTDDHAVASATVLHDNTAPSISIRPVGIATAGTPAIAGLTDAVAGSTVTIAIDADNDGSTDLTYQTTVSASVDGNGNNWSIDPTLLAPSSGVLPSGGLTAYARITASVSDAAGNSATATALDKPTVASQTTHLTTPTVTGTWANLVGDSLYVVINGVAYATSAGQPVTLGGTPFTTVAGLSTSGNAWSLTSGTLSAGTYDVQAFAVRGGSQTYDSTSGELVIDTTAPAVAITAISNDTGTAGDFRSNDTTLVYSGTAEANASVLVTLTGSSGTLFSTRVSADGTGHWSLDRTGQAALEEGSYTLTAQATDAAGNSATTTQAVIIDLSGPAIGITSNGKTADTTPLITGTTDLPAGSSITLVIDPDNVVGGTTYSYTAIVQADGTWSVDTTTAVPAGQPGAVTYGYGNTLGVTASGSDAAGNSASASKAVEIGAAPTIAVTRPSLGGDYTANAAEDDAVVIQGATTGTTLGDSIGVTLTDGSHTVYDTATVDGGGNWQLAALDLSGMNDGTLTVNASLTDAAGNTFQDSAKFSHDKTAPTPTLSAGGSSISAPVTVTVAFDEAITGLSAGDFAASNGAQISNLVAGAGNSYTFTLTPVSNGSLAVWLPAATAADVAGNGNALSNILTFSVTGYAPDTSAPTVVSVLRQGTTPQLTNADSLTYRVTFSEAVQHVDTGDFVAGGSGAGAAAIQSVSAVAGSGGLQYDVVVDNVASNNGVVSLGFNSGHDITDQAGTPNALAANPAIPSSESYTLDNIAPALTASNGASVNGSLLTLRYDEALGSTTPARTDYSVSASGGAISVTGVSVNTTGNQVVLTLDRGVASGETVIVSYMAGAGPIQDLATNVAADLTARGVANLTPAIAIAATVSGDSSIADNLISSAENDGSFTLNGTTDNLADGTAISVTVSDGSHTISKSTTVSGGTWSVDLDTGDVATLNAGTANLTVTATASDGDGSTYSASKSLGKDVTAPTTPTVTSQTTNAAHPVIHGTATLGSGETLSVTVNGATYDNVSVSGGAWSIDTGSAGVSSGTLGSFVDGQTYSVEAMARDAAGNSATDSSSGELTINAANVHPVLLSDSNAAANSVAENASVGATVGVTALGTDADAGTTITYSLTDDAGGKFAIDAGTGVVTVAAALDYETATSHTITVKATSSDGSETSGNFTIAVTNVNDNPVLLSDSNAAANSVAENAAVGASVGVTALGTDADSGTTITYSLTDDASGKFAIDATSGVVTVAAALDYETATSHTITVKATSSDGSETSGNFTIAVTNVNDNPVLLSDSNAAANSVAENAAVGASVGVTALGTDADAGTTVSYSLTDNAGGKFAIDAGTGVVTVAAALDSETATSHTITVKATSSDGSETSGNFTIAVTNVNDNPVLLSDSNAAANSVAENAALGATVGVTALGTDADAGTTITYSLTDDAGGKFAIDAATGVVTVAAALDYETATSHTITVKATSSDGSETSGNFTIAVTNVNDNPVLLSDSNAAANSVAENASVGAIVGVTALGTDADAGTTITYSLTDDAGGKFAIDAGTGVVTVAGALDYETATSHTITIKATSSDGSETSGNFTIAVTNVNDNPVLLSDSNAVANSVAENAAVGASVGVTALGTDADAGTTISYSLTDSAGSKFAIDATSGVVTVAAALDYETATSHTITVKATSSDGSETSGNFTIAVTNVNDNPVLLSDSNAAANTVAENAALGATVGVTALGTDADAGTTISYSLTDSAGGKFAIDATSGVVTVAAALDYETATSHTITVKATSSDGSETSGNFTIAVTNVNDNPVLLSDSNAAANSVAENAAMGATVGVTALGTDADAGATITYSLTDDAGGKFAIDASTGVVTVAGALDYETATSHTITVKATSSDGSETSGNFTIAVTNVNDNPVLLSDSNAAANSVAENASVGASVGVTALGTDADAGTTITYSLTDDAGGKFAIDAATGVVTVAGALDYETATSHTITVKATSSDGSETSGNFTIAVTNVNDNPVLLSDANAAANTVAENASLGASVGVTALGTDADAGATISYSLTDDAGGKFAIDASTGVVTVAGALDYETATSHTITIKATSSDGSETSGNFTIAVTNVNDNPVLLSDSNAASNSVAENAALGATVGVTALGTDADSGATVSYSLTDNAGGKFAIDASTGVVTVAGALDYETATSHTITVKATSSDGSETSGNFTIAVTNVNDNPVLLSDSNAAANTVAENAAVGATVGVTALGTDADAGATITYSLTDDAGGKFAIDAGTGVVTVAAALDYETATSHTITVKATSSDGSETSGNFTIAVTNVNDNPVLLSDSNAAANSVAENAAVGATVGVTALGTDADSGTTISYSLTDDAGGKFAIDAGTGVVTVAAALDYETATSHTITVKATSSDGSETSGNFTIAVTNVNDNPVLLSDSNAAANTVAENAAVGATVGVTALGTDADAGATITYSLTDDAGGKFAIDAGTGVVTVAAALDYETATSHTITVKATSSDGSETSGNFTIAVTNVNDNPVLLSDSNAAANSVAENASVGATVGVTALGTDADAGATITYSLTDDAGGKFAIDASSGVVTVAAALDYETATSHSITVKATSSDGSETSGNFTIAVTNVNDNPVLLSDSNAAANSVAENAALGSSVGVTALGSDADAGTTITYSLTDNAGGKFAIDASTGVVTVAAALDYETATSHTITVKATSSDGSETSGNFIIAVSDVDEIAPGAPVVTGISNDSASVGDHLTNDTTLVFNGTAEANSTVTVYVDGNAKGTTHADTGGHWSFDYTGTPLADASTSQITATATDAAGNTGALSAAYAVSIDTTAPAPVIGINAITTDNVINAVEAAGTVSVTGTVTGEFHSGDSVTLTVNGHDYTGQVDAAGLYSISVPGSALAADADLTIAARVDTTDAAGNPGFGSANKVYLVNVVAPGNPTGSLQHDAASDTGSSDTDNLTANHTPVLTGTADPSNTVTVTLDGHTYTTTADGNGHWSVTVSHALADGTYTPGITATDGAGNTSGVNGSPFTVDHTAPAAPSGHLQNDAANDTGESSTDNVTANPTPILTGTAEANSTVAVTLDGHTYTTTADANGHWSVTVTQPLADGTYTPGITATDAAGNSTTADGTPLTVDQTAPSVPTVDALVATSGTPTLTGSAVLNPGERLAVTVNGVTYTVGDGHLSVTGTTWSLAVPTTLVDGTYSVTARVTDAAGNSSVDATQSELVVDTSIPSHPDTPAASDAPTQQTTPPDQPPSDQGGETRSTSQDLQETTAPTGQGEVRTTNGFHVLVEERATPGAPPELRLEKNIPDQQPSSGSNVIQFVVPMDTFVHTDPTATVTLSAVMVDGTALPTWLTFDPTKGEFHGVPPEGLRGELLIKVTARDDSGRQAETVVRIRVGEKVDQLSFLGRPGLTTQMKAQGAFAWKAERDRLIQVARAANHAAPRPTRAA